MFYFNLSGRGATRRWWWGIHIHQTQCGKPQFEGKLSKRSGAQCAFVEWSIKPPLVQPDTGCGQASQRFSCSTSAGASWCWPVSSMDTEDDSWWRHHVSYYCNSQEAHITACIGGMLLHHYPQGSLFMVLTLMLLSHFICKCCCCCCCVSSLFWCQCTCCCCSCDCNCSCSCCCMVVYYFFHFDAMHLTLLCTWFVGVVGAAALLCQ